MTETTKLRIFHGFGIELEYMLVDSETLNILPVSDELMRSVKGRYSCEVNTGCIGWSNELVLHVIELRNIKPVSTLSSVSEEFQHEVNRINKLLRKYNGILMSTSMHPWMNPKIEAKLWPHRNQKIYETYNRIFDCFTHGWSNIQSTQINISFSDETEFAKLHSAARLLLPIIPAITASSPIVEGKNTGWKDTRLVFYFKNQKKIPSVSGKIIPEAVFSKKDYKKRILNKIYDDIAEYDPDGILKHEWLNSRGAIPRFRRNALEIRISDIQECPAADIAVSTAIVEVLKALVREQWSDWKEQASWKIAPLLNILRDSIKMGESAIIKNPRYLKIFDYPESQATAQELWHHLVHETLNKEALNEGWIKDILSSIIKKGTLSSRIQKATGKHPSHKRLRRVYKGICECLAKGKLFNI